jgi:hypothetical protein
MAEQLRRLFNIRNELDRHIERLEQISKPDAVIPDDHRNYLASSVDQLRMFFESHRFANATTAATRIIEKQLVLTPTDAKRRLEELWEDFMRDCDTRRIEIIEADKLPHYDAGFGHEVSYKFPDATKEIKEAGTCYSLGRHTACVFHLMRVAEHGVRALTVAAGVSQSGLKVPVEYACWDDLVNRVTAAVKAVPVGTWSAPAKSNFRAFYHGSLSDFTAFKDECRNLLMHTRSGLYNEHEAANWMTRVRGFMERLATKVSEQATTPLLEERDWQ